MKEKTKTVKIIKWIITAFSIIAGVIVARLPETEGLSRNGLMFLGIFIPWIVSQLSAVLPILIPTLLAVVLFVVLGVGDFATVFSMGSSSITWLITGAFGMSIAIHKSGLFKRIAFGLMRLFPASFGGQLAAITTASVLVGPTVPDYMARSSILTPVINAVVDIFGFEPHSKGAVGLYAAPQAFWNMTAGIIFVTGGGFPAIVMAASGQTFSWVGWFKVFWLWGAVVTALTIIYTFIRYNPAQKGEKLKIDKEELKARAAEMGAMSSDEIYALCVIVLAIFLWITEGSLHSIPTALVAVMAWVLLMLKGTFAMSDFAKMPWITIFYTMGLLAILTLMSTSGVTAWVSTILAPALSGFAASPLLTFALIAVVVSILRLPLVSTMILITVMTTVFSSSGISPLIVGAFTAACGNMHVLSFQNLATVTAVGASDGRIEHKDIIPMAIMYQIFCLAAAIISMPYWSMLGVL